MTPILNYGIALFGFWDRGNEMHMIDNFRVMIREFSQFCLELDA